MVRPHRAESGAGGGAASLRARRRRVRSWGPAAREAGGSKGGAAPLARPQCSTLRGLALPCEQVKTGPVPLALPRPCVAACHPALCSAPIVGEGSRRWGHFRGSSATAARCSTGRRDDVSAPGPVSATRRIRPSWRAGAAGRSSSGWMGGRVYQAAAQGRGRRGRQQAPSLPRMLRGEAALTVLARRTDVPLVRKSAEAVGSMLAQAAPRRVRPVPAPSSRPRSGCSFSTPAA